MMQFCSGGRIPMNNRIEAWCSGSFEEFARKGLLMDLLLLLLLFRFCLG